MTSGAYMHVFWVSLGPAVYLYLKQDDGSQWLKVVKGLYSSQSLRLPGTLSPRLDWRWQEVATSFKNSTSHGSKAY